MTEIPRCVSSFARRRAPAAAALFLTVVGCKTEAPPASPPEVKAAMVLHRDVPVYVEAIGQTRGNTETEIRARVEGFIEKVHFDEGTMVKPGQLLYTLDPRPFQEALAQARAKLAEAEAQWARTQQDVARFEPLVADNAVSRQEYETSVALEKAAAAAVDAAKAAARRAEIDLGYTRVTAPDSGLAGRTEVQAGTLVGRGQPTLLTRISKIDPIHVRFTLSETDYIHYARARLGRGGTGDPKLPSFELILADGSAHPHEGRFIFVDRAVDPETGTILLEAAFPNPEEIVRPGQYGRVRAAVDNATTAASARLPRGVRQRHRVSRRPDSRTGLRNCFPSRHARRRGFIPLPADPVPCT